MADPASVLGRFPGGYWRVPAFLDYVQPALTDQMVADAEAQLGVRLPLTYLQLLHQQNGGYLRASRGIADTLRGIGPNFPSITRDETWWRPGNTNEGFWAPPRPELLIPFDGDGHWDLCFDYRVCGTQGEPSITWVSCESENEEAVAESFLDYLAQLVDETAEKVMRVYDAAGAEVVARRLAQHLAIAPPTMDDFAHGYPIWRLGPSWPSEWCWCSQNRVPAGFRRADASIVTTKETALRLPEDPDCKVLVGCTDGWKEQIARALRATR